MGILNWLKLFWPGALDKLLTDTAWDAYEDGHKQGVEDGLQKSTRAYKQGYWDGAKDAKANTLRNFIEDVTNKPSVN